eukprot:gene10021-5533_t
MLPRAGVRSVLGQFDVVGLTERLADTMFLLCRAAGLALCPILPRPIATGDARGKWAQSAYPGALAPGRAAVERLAAADFALHRLAKERLSAGLAALPPDASAAHRAYLEAHESHRGRAEASGGHASNATAEPCAPRLVFGKRSRVVRGADLRICALKRREPAANGSSAAVAAAAQCAHEDEG